MGKITVIYKDTALLELEEGQIGKTEIPQDGVVIEIRKHQEENGLATYTGRFKNLGSHNHIGAGRKHDLSKYTDNLLINHERG